MFFYNYIRISFVARKDDPLRAEHAFRWHHSLSCMYTIRKGKSIRERLLNIATTLRTNFLDTELNGHSSKTHEQQACCCG